MTAVLLDTGCIVALLDRSEEHHEQCVEVVSAIQEQLITCEAVIAESCYLLRGIHGAAAAVVENASTGIFQIPYFVKDRGPQIVKLLKKYSNVPMDFADACLVDMATEFQTGRILTLDRDFKIYRWAKNRAFEFLLKP
jgi:predicted nucleic acid-binding protein